MASYLQLLYYVELVIVVVPIHVLSVLLGTTAHIRDIPVFLPMMDDYDTTILCHHQATYHETQR